MSGIKKKEKKEVGSDGLNIHKECEDRAQELQRTIDEYLSGWKRAQADYENLKREESRRFETMIQFANKAIMIELVAVLDSFALAIKAIEKPDQGVVQIKLQLQEVLKRNGLELISVEAEKDIFNPSLHEAISMRKGDEGMSQKIAEVIDQGYRLRGIVIRPAKVIIYE